MNEIRAKEVPRKKVWIKGHSLGAAHAQLFDVLAEKGNYGAGQFMLCGSTPRNSGIVIMNRLFPKKQVAKI